MVEHDRRGGEGARQIDEFAELGVVHPRVKAEAERREPGEALAHFPVHQQAGGAQHRRAPRRLIRMRRRDKADAVEMSAAGRNLLLQHLFDRPPPTPDRHIRRSPRRRVFP
jgi:hypothetical protein